MNIEERLRINAKTLKESANIPRNSPADITEGNIMKENQPKKVFRNAVCAIAGLAASFVLVVNCVPKLAYASYSVPVLGPIVKVVTFERFRVKKDGYEANIETPKIEGLLNKDLEDKLNAEFKEHSKSIIAAFEQDVKELEKQYGNGFHLGVDASYIVRTDNEDILAIDTYIVNTAASSSTKHSFYTIDKKTGTLIRLSDLFKKDADYVTPISEYIISEMQKQNDDGTGLFWIGNDEVFDGFERIKEDQNFFINDSGNIVICFDKYEVAAGAQGSPEFEIPNRIIEDILK